MGCGPNYDVLLLQMACFVYLPYWLAFTIAWHPPMQRPSTAVVGKLLRLKRAGYLDLPRY